MTWFLPAYHFSFLTSFSDTELLPASSEAPLSCCRLFICHCLCLESETVKMPGLWVQIQRPPLTSCVNVGGLLNLLCEPQFHHLKVGLIVVLTSEL